MLEGKKKKNLVPFLQSQVFLHNHEIEIGADESSDGDSTKRIDEIVEIEEVVLVFEV